MIPELVVPDLTGTELTSRDRQCIYCMPGIFTLPFPTPKKEKRLLHGKFVIAECCGAEAVKEDVKYLPVLEEQSKALLPFYVHIIKAPVDKKCIFYYFFTGQICGLQSYQSCSRSRPLD